MAHRKSKPVNPEARDLDKLSADYNLEKEPLQTGEKQPRVDLRERVAMRGSLWTARGMFVLSLIVVVVILAVLAAVNFRSLDELF